MVALPAAPFVTASHCCPSQSSTVRPLNVTVPLTVAVLAAGPVGRLTSDASTCAVILLLLPPPDVVRSLGWQAAATRDVAARTASVARIGLPLVVSILGNLTPCDPGHE